MCVGGCLCAFMGVGSARVSISHKKKKKTDYVFPQGASKNKKLLIVKTRIKLNSDNPHKQISTPRKVQQPVTIIHFPVEAGKKFPEFN